MAENTNTEREAVARAIWAVLRENEDRCDQELEDVPPTHHVWACADAARASLSLPAAGQEPVAWTGGEEWEQLAWHLCAEENGEESCGELIWEGGPVPEPWGDRWMKYEGDAKRMIELVRKFAAPQPAVAAGWVKLPGQLPEPCKPVLLDIGRKYPIRAMWAPKFTLPTDGDVDYGEYDEATDDYYCHEGWYEWNQNEETHWAVSETPRAWCELPKALPPAPSTEGESRGTQ